MARKKKNVEIEVEEKEEVVEENKEELPIEVPEAVVEPQKELPLFACKKCGGEMKILKAVANEKLWECVNCKYRHCQMR